MVNTFEQSSERSQTPTPAGSDADTLADVTLDDKYRLEKGRVFLNGIQALVRLTLIQQQLDKKAGLNTAGYVTGYRGSPLGGVDREFHRASAFLQEHNVKFHPAVNEDLAATALWGSQQVNMYEGAKFDGVFGMWYGKGPGVDRSGDVFRHANSAGTSPNGGVLLLAGDDPACKSSTVPSQSEHALIDANIPVLNPVNVQEVIDFGILGWAMSRYSGCWVGMKCITDNVDSSAAVLVDPERIKIQIPTDFDMPEDGLHIRWPDPAQEQELRLQGKKIYAALAFARANNLNRVTIDGPKARFGIVATGKSYLDTLQALSDLGIDEDVAKKIGLRLYKVGMPWPLEREGVREFADGLEEILVIEEKRAVMENQIKEQLYNWREDVRPKVVGKFDEDGNWILPSAGELTPARIARVIAARIKRFHQSDSIDQQLAFFDRKEKALDDRKTKIQRIPFYCSGCPHNTSTKVPEGSRATAGIGCHYMTIWMDRDTSTFTHMGGEGANWIGQAPFTNTEHTFVNLGDGTYFHSGILAIRAAVAANVNITYKILYNDAVAMTGGQTMDGPLDVAIMSRQVHAEGVKRIMIISDEPDKYPIGTQFAPGVTFHHRDDFDALQKDIRRVKGVSIIIYDQTCAAEKRRRRKRGLYPDPMRRIFINPDICEGCGDCGEQSNCVSITPLETELGRKRAIDQSSCNKDYTCIKGFCPSFVSVEGVDVRKPKGKIANQTFPVIPEPTIADCDKPYSIIVNGIGGTGVITIGAVLAMAAHLEGKGITVLDIAGLAQKNGAVYSHIRIAKNQDDLHAVRVAAGDANLLLGCDLISSGSSETLGKLRTTLSKAVVNTQNTMTSDFTTNPDVEFPEKALHDSIQKATGENNVDFIEATSLALGLLGNTIAANMFIVGFAAQKGLLPLSIAAVERAIELNGISVSFNKQAFLWGRRSAHDKNAVAVIAGINEKPPVKLDPQDFPRRRAQDLVAYQNQALADKYTQLLSRVALIEKAATPGQTALHDAVAQSYFKVLAYKDEYEVSRLYTDGRFDAAIQKTFNDGHKIKFHFASPLLTWQAGPNERPKKSTFGPWVIPVLKILSKLKVLRGTAFDVFGLAHERKLERQMIVDFEATVDQVLKNLTPDNHGQAVAIIKLSMTVRGFGPVKIEALEKYKIELAARMILLNTNAPAQAAE